MSTNKINILAVDDHPLVLKGLEEFLIESQKYGKIFTAKNGEEALKVIKTNKVQLVLLDLKMPILDGFETLKIISNDFPNLKVIIVSFDGSIESIRKTLADGASGYVRKEFALEELPDAIDIVTKGEIYYSKEITNLLLRDYKNHLNESKVEFTKKGRTGA